jgi:hypothetical protein
VLYFSQVLATGNMGSHAFKGGFMNLNNRYLTRMLVVAALALGVLAAVPAMAAEVVYVEGSVAPGPEPGCVLVKDHEGRVYALEGTGWYGVLGSDYVRLEGRIVPESRCGVTAGLEVANVSNIWRDEGRKVIIYDRTREGRFADWVRRHREREWREWEREHHIPPPPPPQ